MIYYLRRKPAVFCCCALLLLVFAGCGSLPKQREFTEEEKAFRARYLEDFSVEVLFFEASGEDELFQEAVMGFARGLLSRDGLLAGEAGEGAAVIVIDAASEGDSRNENHYGMAFIRCIVIEPFTGARRELPGVAAPRTFSKASQFDAAANAAQTALARMLPEVVAQTRAFLLELYEEGN